MTMKATEWQGWDSDGGRPIVARYRAEVRDDVCYILIDGTERSSTEKPYWAGLVEQYPHLGELLGHAKKKESKHD